MTDGTGDNSLFDDVMRESAEQWMSLVDECEVAGYCIFPLDQHHWQLFPMTDLMGTEH